MLPCDTGEGVKY